MLEDVKGKVARGGGAGKALQGPEADTGKRTIEYHRMQAIGKVPQMTEKDFVHRFLNRSNEAAGRRIVMPIKERDAAVAAATKAKKEKLHSIRDGRRTHLEEFKRQLHKRKDLVKEIIQEEYDKFEDIIKVEKEIENKDAK